ncbi:MULTISPECIES: hypothetical protein [unclassified Acidovorax]|uniref:hypothetical protein n=1 Tax=unclassified Acidovorax TaxID=2684926 RepID=UPI0010EA3B21|nr:MULTISPECIES: hypothetical protein [unclassified Acidovorax]MCZ8220640.1 hypothetical protein [Acidovorax sp.]GDY37797.1 hypothetical protein ACINB_36890 [Acidovorax sp. NB1]
MSQNADIVLARELYRASELASKQVIEAQSLVKDLFPGAEHSRADILAIAQLIAINYAGLHNSTGQHKG